MFSQTGGHMAVSGLPAWHILFAREPEEEVELDEAGDTEETSLLDAEGDDQPEPDGGGRRKLLMLTLLAVLAGGGLYLAMDPDMVMNLMGTGPEPAPMPPPPNRAPDAPAGPAASTSPAPEAAVRPAPPASAPQDMAKAPTAPLSPAPPANGPPATPGPQPSPFASQPAMKPAASGNSPLFAEGQAIVVLTDPAKPGGPVALMADAEGNRPGPSVAPNTAATILDGERRSNVWIYAIRTAQGATGWIAERQLKAAIP